MILSDTARVNEGHKQRPQRQAGSSAAHDGLKLQTYSRQIARARQKPLLTCLKYTIICSEAVSPTLPPCVASPFYVGLDGICGISATLAGLSSFFLFEKEIKNPLTKPLVFWIKSKKTAVVLFSEEMVHWMHACRTCKRGRRSKDVVVSSLAVV